MQVIDDTLIDFDAYLAAPDESAFVRCASSYTDALIDRFYNREEKIETSLPWGKYQFTISFRPMEVTLWLGVNGHGKSLLLGQLATSFCSQGEKVLIISFEMKPVTTLARMCRQASMGPNPAIGFIKSFSEWTDEKLWMYDQQGTVKSDRVLAVCRYFAKELSGTHVVIDSLMKCIADDDGYNEQKRFVDSLTSIARDNNLHIHLVHHSRKLSDENSPPGKMDAKGTGAITDQVDNCVTIWRNKRKESEMAKGKGDPDAPDALLIVDKQRNGEWEGRIALWYDRDSQQFLPGRHAKPMDLMCFW